MKEQLKQKLKIFFENPTQEGFDELKKMEDRDDSLALLILVTKNQIDFFSFEEWETVYEYSTSTSKIKKSAAEEMSKLKTTFPEWDYVHTNSATTSNMKELAIKKMAELANTFEEWEQVYYEVNPCNTYQYEEIKELALQKMTELI